jgi:hypothetical protein
MCNTVFPCFCVSVLVVWFRVAVLLPFFAPMAEASLTRCDARLVGGEHGTGCFYTETQLYGFLFFCVIIWSHF